MNVILIFDILEFWTKIHTRWLSFASW